MKPAILLACFIAYLMLIDTTRGAEPTEVGTQFETKKILSGLNNPWGIAVRAMRSSPGTFEVFLAESGAGRVVRVWTQAPEKVSPFIEGFETGPLSADSPWNVGPMGLTWVKSTKLAVTTASEKLVRVYTLPLHSKPLDKAETDHVAEPSLATKRIDGTGITAIASSGYTAFFTINTMSPSAGILQAEVRSSQLKRITPLLGDAQSATDFYAAGVATTPSNRPEFVVVARQPVDRTSDASRLAFYDPTSGALALDMEVPLRNLAALAYSPSGNLYAVAVEWENPQQGGVYRLEDARRDGQQYCRLVKVATIARPVDLEFADRKTLYVSSLGEEVNGSKGSLIQITGDF